MDIVYVSDFFLKDVLGGAELNDHELIFMLKNKYKKIEKLYSKDVTIKVLEERKHNFFIISNFSHISLECLNFLEKTCKYIIYEHDHKYLKNRNPSVYKNFICPKEEIINYNFYSNAKRVFGQSNFQLEIIKNNLNINNLENLGGNLWSEEILNYFLLKSKEEKKEKYSIINYFNPLKGKDNAIFYCENKKLDYDIVEDFDYLKFLEKLSKNKYLIFFPELPETLSRICVEAKMMNIKIFTNKNVGAIYEDWCKLSGDELIVYMKNQKNIIFSKIDRCIYE